MQLWEFSFFRTSLNIQALIYDISTYFCLRLQFRVFVATDYLLLYQQRDLERDRSNFDDQAL